MTLLSETLLPTLSATGWARWKWWRGRRHEHNYNPFAMSLMKLLAIRLGRHKTSAKSLVMSKGEHSAKSHSWFDRLTHERLQNYQTIRLHPPRSPRRPVHPRHHHGRRVAHRQLQHPPCRSVAHPRHRRLGRAEPIGDTSGARRLSCARHPDRRRSPGGTELPWQEEVIATPNPTMRRIVVNVYAPDDAKHSLRELTGYLVQFPR